MKRTLSGIALLAMTTLANADTLPAARYAELMRMPMMDTDKDGFVSREEFLAAAGKMFDMALESMKAKDGRMTDKQLADFRQRIGSGR